MPPEKLKINIDQRRALVETADRSNFVAVSDRIAAFILEDVGGEVLLLDALVQNGPVVLVFFRFAGCRACNIALPYYNRHLAPELARLGATLVGVSPQVPERLAAIKERHGLEFLIATDRDNALGRRFGILYTFDEAVNFIEVIDYNAGAGVTRKPFQKKSYLVEYARSPGHRHRTCFHERLLANSAGMEGGGFKGNVRPRLASLLAPEVAPHIGALDPPGIYRSDGGTPTLGSSAGNGAFSRKLKKLK